MDLQVRTGRGSACCLPVYSTHLSPSHLTLIRASTPSASPSHPTTHSPSVITITLHTTSIHLHPCTPLHLPIAIHHPDTYPGCTSLPFTLPALELLGGRWGGGGLVGEGGVLSLAGMLQGMTDR